MDSENLILEARDLVENADSITVLTGAGISAESGIPIFRGNEGLWNNFKPEELASPQAFKLNPDLVWQWYDWRRNIINDAQPNSGHYALAEIERQKHKFTLITQNIDGLHHLAGNQNITEMHGNIWETRCENCNAIERNYEVPLTKLPPICNRCNSILRPNIVWFGEIIPMEVIDRGLLAIDECDLMLIIGTSGIVEPAASMGLIAKQSDKKVIEINLEPTPNSGLYDISIQGKSGEILPLFYEIERTYN